MTQQDILAGVRVVDFSRYIAGPYCGALLAYLGADVIRVEKSGGSEDRYVVPMAEEVGALFAQSAVNKRSISVNLKHELGQQVITRLVSQADVVIVNHPPSGLRALGLDYESLRAIKPDIILTTQTAYGHEGPWAERSGFDGIGQVMSGAAHFGGEPDEPVKAAAAYVDFGTALYSAFATLGALYQKRDSGEGQHIQASLLGTATTFFSPILIEQWALNTNREPSGNRSQTSAPSDIFKTSDGHVLISVVGNGMFKRLSQVVGEEAWAENPDYDSDMSRGVARDHLCDVVARWCADRDSETVLDKMGAAGVPCGPVLKPAETLTHPQIEAMQFLKNVPAAGMNEGATVVDFPVSMSGAPSGVRGSIAGLGEHTDEILRELGYNEDEVSALHEAGAL